MSKIMFDTWKKERPEVGDRVEYKVRVGEWRRGKVIDKNRMRIEKKPFSAYFYTVQDDNADRPAHTTRYVKKVMPK